MAIEHTESPPTASVRALLTGIIDYAGLFPPSKLEMDVAVRNFAEYRASGERWMLARLVVPASRLGEFEEAAAGLLPTGEDDEPWRLSALVAPDPQRDVDAIFAFNSRHEEDPSLGKVVADTVELKGESAEQIDRVMEQLPAQLKPFFELDHRRDIRGELAAIAGTGGRAKIRCGGVTPDLIPKPVEVARFIHACAAADVAFKATAGLHHPVRAEHALTYDADAPRGVMHGFLNVFMAAALARTRRFDVDQLVDVLSETDPKAFLFADDAASWRTHAVDAARLTRVRESGAISVGSCSFTEPVADLRAMGVGI